MEKVNDPDAALVLRIADGDQQAASQLIERHAGKLVALSRNMLGDAVEAEDVVQEVFVKVWVHAASWSPGKAKFATWLHRVAVNLCYDRLRKKREVLMNELPDQTDDAQISAEQMVMNQQRGGMIEQAMMLLAPRQRAAISLCHLQELGNIEAAAVMDISVEALESLLGRGRRSLAGHLAAKREFLLDR